MTASSSKGGISVLGAMQAAVMDKAPAPTKDKPTLTRLPGEAAGVTGLAAVRTKEPFPNDDPTDAVRMSLVVLRREHAALGEVIASLEALIGEISDGGTRATPEEAQKERERAADARVAGTVNPLVELGKQIIAEDKAAADVLTAAVSAADARARKKADKDALLAESGLVDADEAETFAERQARIAREAQAAVFTEPSGASVALAEDMGVDTAEEWFCPVHGKAIEKTSARRQRTYRACPEPNCNEFERL